MKHVAVDKFEVYMNRYTSKSVGNLECIYQDAFDHDKGQKSAVSGHPLHCILKLPPVDDFFSRF